MICVHHASVRLSIPYPMPGIKNPLPLQRLCVPCEGHRVWEAQRERDDDETHLRIWDIEEWKNLRRDLGD